MNLGNVIAVRDWKTIYRDGDKAVKVFDKNYSKSAVLNEALNQARIEETALNIPKIIEVTTVDGKWAIVYDFIEGKTLLQLMRENPGKQAEYIERLVDLQLKVHEQRVPLLNRQREKMQAKISATDFDATTRYELHTRLDSLPKHHKVCHGDFNPSNIIITDDGREFILDWSHATQGNASLDAARTYLLFSLHGGSEIAGQYLKLFCRKSDTAQQYVQKCMPIVAASKSVKSTAEEREFLTSWVNVVEY